MRCDDIIGLLSCYIDGEVSPVERAAVEEHVRECESCRKLLDEMANIRRAFAELVDADVPPDLHEGIMMRIRGARTGVQSADRREIPAGGAGPGRTFPVRWFGWVRHPRLSWAMPALAGALVMLILVGSFGIIRDLVARRTGQPGYRVAEGLGKEVTPVPGAGDAGKLPPGTGGGGEGGGSSTSESGRTSDSSKNLRTIFTDVTQSGLPRSGEATAPGTKGEDVYSAAASVIQRKIIRNARMTISVSRGVARDALDRARAIIEGAGGYVESSSLVTSDPATKRNASAYVVGRVPAENLTKTMQDIRTLGQLIDQSESAQDVTEQHIDLSARVRAKEAQEARLIQIMGEAKTVGELLQVEAELWRVRAEIESIQGQLNYIERASALSALSVNFVEEGATVGAERWSNFWKEVWEAFVTSWKGIFVFGAKIFPWVTVLALISVVPVAVLRSRRRS
ncbi:MAG: DUF4349 domain-containing protein [Firmicutes bacterium]|nr:DUF4349 domain-containing protein [Candidatus Fermentithermobacillaceae bacterium]